MPVISSAWFSPRGFGYDLDLVWLSGVLDIGVAGLQ
jgi:hypothetical protein